LNPRGWRKNVNVIRLKDYKYIDLDVQPWPEAFPSPLVVVSTSQQTNHTPYSARQVGDVFLREHVTGGEPSKIEFVVCLGSPERISLETIRKAGGLLARWLADHMFAECFVDVDQFHSIGIEEAFSTFCEGLLLGAFQFKSYKPG